MLKKNKPNKDMQFIFGVTPEEDKYFKTLVKTKEPEQSLSKSILNTLNGPNHDVYRLGFEADPTAPNSYAAVYKNKLRLLPDSVLKRIAIQDSLVSNIVRARQNHVSAFGRPRPDRFSAGFVIRPNVGVTEGMTKEEKHALNDRIQKAIAKLVTCGNTKGVKDPHQKTFSEYLSLIARDSQVVGRIATEIVYINDIRNSDKKDFHYFTHIDAGTIYPAVPDSDQAKQSIRDDAYNLLCRVTGKKDLVKENWNKDNEYDWVQVIDGRPEQVFTSQELKCRNFYPAGNVELDGFPVTPIDTVISAVTTHLHITTFNKVYFENGRAARGMLIIRSDDVNPTVIHNIKQQFNSSINGSQRSFRMPVLGFGSETEVDWKPIDSSGQRDMEFQYLTDLNAREILTAFMMSPDELPGWSYLSRGTNSQALSESNSEFKMLAARDVGIRPLIATLEDYINEELFPLIDPEISDLCRIVLCGLDAESPEKEVVNIQQNSQVHMTYNDIMEKVEKKAIPKEFGGDCPLNPMFQKITDAYMTVGEYREYFMGIKDASKDPRWDYCRDNFWFNQQQLMQAQQQMQMQQQAQEQQSQMQQQAADQQNTQQEQDNQEGSDLSSGVNQASEVFSKSEESLPPNHRKLLQKQKQMMSFLLDGFKSDQKDCINAILEETKNLAPKK